jgi:hypothetical protein
MSDWLELELADQLAPAEAPDSLWSHVQRASQPKPTPQRTFSPVAVIVTVMAVAGVLWMAGKGQRAPLDARLAANEQQAQQRPSSPVGATTDLYLVSTKADREGSICIRGAAFRVPGGHATMLVAHAPTRLWSQAGMDWETSGLPQGELACAHCHRIL